MKRGRLTLFFMIAAPVFIAIMTWILIIRVAEESWVGIFSGGLILILWVRLGINNYRWFRWTRPIDSMETLSQEP